jgi:hypothetical protein
VGGWNTESRRSRAPSIGRAPPGRSVPRAAATRPRLCRRRGVESPSVQAVCIDGGRRGRAPPRASSHCNAAWSLRQCWHDPPPLPRHLSARAAPRVPRRARRCSAASPRWRQLELLVAATNATFDGGGGLSSHLSAGQAAGCRSCSVV